VVCVGDVVTDVVVQGVGSLRPGDGEPATLAFRSGDDTPASISLAGGGSAANVAAWIGHLGTPVALVARVGADALSFHRDSLVQSGVEPLLAVDPDAPTGTIVALIGPDGERSFLTDRGANLRLAPADLPPDRIEQAAWLHLSAYTLLDPACRPAGLAAIERARAAGVPWSLDVASAAGIEAAGAATVLGWVAGVALLLANTPEALALTGAASALAAARSLAATGAGAVIVKQGAQGALVAAPDREPTAVPALSVDVVDTTGAGDSFAAGTIVALLGGASLIDAARAGTAVAARAVAAPGARPRPHR
jgi:sugar/nucleoside kinase (ribokinase family)